MQVMANDFSATCQNFEGVEYDSESGELKPYLLNDGTIFEFSYTSANGGSIRYLVDGVGIIEPKKAERWHDLQLLQQTRKYVTAINLMNDDYKVFTLYPESKILHIAWVEHPNRKYKSGGSFLIKVGCEFTIDKST